MEFRAYTDSSFIITGTLNFQIVDTCFAVFIDLDIDLDDIWFKQYHAIVNNDILLNFTFLM